MFLDPTIDFAFKRVFGNQAYPEITISFLNALLGSRLQVPVVSIDFLDPFNQQETKELKYSILDIRCTDQLKRQFIIEIQVKAQEFFPKRIQYYRAQAIARQLKAHVKYDAIMPVILVSILDFDMLSYPEYLNSYSLQHDVHHTLELSLVSYVFVELKKFHLALAELATIQEKWVYFIKHANELDAIPKELATTIEFEEAFELLKSGNLSEAELAIYDKALDSRRVELDALATAEAKGIAEGKAEGIAEGKAEGIAEGKAEGERQAKRQLAKNLLAEKMSVDLVAKLTGLSVEEIKKL